MTSPDTTVPGRGGAPSRAATNAAQDRELLARSRSRVRSLFPDLPDTLEDLRVHMEGLRGNDIILTISDPGRLKLPSGMWGQVRDDGGQGGIRDLIWVDQRTSPFAHVVVACHEFGHMICGHEPQPLSAAVADPRPVNDLAASISLGAASIAAIVGRCGEQFELGSAEWRQEREAELTGRILAQHILKSHGPERRSRRWTLLRRR